MKIALFISYYFHKKIACIPSTQRFEKAYESKYQKKVSEYISMQISL